jgi:c-di-GMP phosphodiesterase
MSLHYYVGRQPIFDNSSHVVGYELLYRSDEVSRGEFNPDQATSNVILNLLETGLSEVVGEHPAYINVTKHFIADDILPTRSVRQIVLEIQNDIDANPQVIESINKLQSLGYLIALDNFTYQKSLKPLYQLANIVKLDIQTYSKDTLEQEISLLKNYPVKIVALKVETPQELHTCNLLGIDYFQGFFFSKPQVLKKTRLSQNRLVSLRLLQEINNPKINIGGIEEIIKLDVTLSYKLLRYINSAAFGLQHDIKGIKHAIVCLGLDEIKRWASLIVLADISDKPDELTKVSLVRAEMCELLARASGKGNPETAFLVGLFSTLDSMMDISLNELFQSLPVSKDIKEALLDKMGVYRDYLDAILAYEKADWPKIDSIKYITKKSVTKFYIQSIKWADDKMKKLTAR